MINLRVACSRLSAVLGAAALASTLSACGAGKTSAAASSPDAQWTLPAATSTVTPQGVWAAVAMGHLGDPLNTFWQLPSRRAGRATWTNQVEATATATNGGLILASAGGTLLVGIRPSVDLTFSPLIYTRNGGLKWSAGLLDTALTPAAGSLAVRATGTASTLTASALTSDAATSTKGGDVKVESDKGSLSSWRTVGDLRSLDASTANRGCGATSLTAVGYSGATLVVGAACSQAGSNGLFTVGPGGWRSAGPSKSVSAGSTVTVLAAASEADSRAAAGSQSASAAVAAPEAFLLGLAGPAGEPPRLVVASSPDGANWQVSPAITVTSTTAVVSFGPAPAGGLFVLTRGPRNALTPYVTDGPSFAWRQLPSAPPGTATLAEGHDGTLEALSVNDTVLSFSTFEPAEDEWVRSQTMHVNIEFGSSNP